MHDSFVSWMIAGGPRDDDNVGDTRRLAHLAAIRDARADARTAGSLGILARLARFGRHEQAPVDLADCCAAA